MAAPAEESSSAQVEDVVVQSPETISAATLRTTLEEALQGKDLHFVSLGETRRQVAAKLGFTPEFFLEQSKPREHHHVPRYHTSPGTLLIDTMHPF